MNGVCLHMLTPEARLTGAVLAPRPFLWDLPQVGT